MCGIAGFLDHHVSDARAEAILRAMGATLVHRGPDADGLWYSRSCRVGLAHRRLSIIDLSPAGAQPMLSASGRYAITFNGEIYNHHEIRRELIAASPAVSFRGRSDTEVMLAAIEHFGFDAAITRLNGMFAAAVLDQHERKLLLVRDRLGEKPLYYGRVGRSFVFASQLKALAAHPDWSGTIDADALQDYLRYGFVPAPHSIWSGIQKLLPGEILQLNVAADLDTPVGLRRYWSAASAATSGLGTRLNMGRTDVLTRLEQLVSDAVAIRMESDVPLGAFLSGGIDSSLVVAMMQRHTSTPVRTFSIGFREERFNEAESARAVAAHLGTQHTELYVSPADALAVIPHLPRIYDEPFADSSQIPTFLLADMTRKHVTVALSGDGGDELFCGYHRYPVARTLWRAMRVAPTPLRRVIATLIEQTPIESWKFLNAILPARISAGRPGDRMRKLASRLRLRSFDDLYDSLLALSGEMSSLAALPAGRGPHRPEKQIMSLRNELERMMAWDLDMYLPDDILVKVDRATMAVSLEGRMPLLDHRLVEFAWQMPMSLKQRGSVGKWALKEVLYRHVPRALVDRPKQGFGAPVEFWLQSELRDWAGDLLSDEALGKHGLFDSNRVQRKFAEHVSGERAWTSQLWTILMFQAWFTAQSTFTDYGAG